ncbi:MAG: SLC13 family permease [Acidobacteria bacterium]|nr:SLC13 family permease [Acidobacteriota bacterium]
MALVAIIILVIALIGFFSERIPNFAVTSFVMAALALSGILDVNAILSGLSNSAVITIATMFILSRGLLNTGALQPLTVRMARWSRGQTGRLVLVLAVTVSVASGFINNTPIVIMMVPVLMALSREFQVAPSKLFIPLAYFAILGGTCTLMGTATNLLVDGFYRDAGGSGFSVLEFSRLGIWFLLVGVLYMVLFGQRLLPERESLSSLLPEEKRSTYVSEVVVTPDSGLLGKQVEQAFPSLGVIRFLELVRDEEMYLGAEASAYVLTEGDALILEGEPEDIASFLEKERADLATVVEDDSRVPLRTTETTVYELVIIPDSTFVGRRVRDLGLNRQFGVKVMAVQRSGRHHRMDLRMMRLKVGDTLLVQAEPEHMALVKEAGNVLVVEEYRMGERARRAKRAMATLVAVVVLAMLGVAPLVVLALAGCAVMVMTGCLRGEEALRSIDANVILIMVGTIPLGEAMVETGLIGILVEAMMEFLGSDQPVLLVSALYLLSNLLTAVLSNATVAVLMAPFAFALSASLGVSVEPFLMAIAFGSCTCFVSPIGYQANLIVMGPGGYNVKDYVRVGLPLSFLLWGLATFAIPRLWPF